MVSTADSLLELLEHHRKSVLMLEADLPAELGLHEALQAVWTRMEEEKRDVMVFQYPFVSIGYPMFEASRSGQGSARVVNWRHMRHVLYGMEPSPACVDVVTARPDETVSPYNAKQVYVAWRTAKPPGFVYKPLSKVSQPAVSAKPAEAVSIYEQQKQYYDNDLPTFIRETGQHRYTIVAELTTPYRKRATRLLSVGCGTGTLEHVLAEHFDVVGIDLSPVLIDYANTEHKGKGKYLVRNAVTDDLADLGSFNIIVMCDAMEHIRQSDRETLLKNLQRVMESRCVFILSFPDGDYLRWLSQTQPDRLQPVDEPVSKYWVTDAIGRMGFGVVRILLTDEGKAWAIVLDRGW